MNESMIAITYITTFIRGIVDMLKELRTTEMEHELRENGKLRGEAERTGIVGCVGGELST